MYFNGEQQYFSESVQWPSTMDIKKWNFPSCNKSLKIAITKDRLYYYEVPNYSTNIKTSSKCFMSDFDMT